jgi:hypothetical protein
MPTAKVLVNQQAQMQTANGDTGATPIDWSNCKTLALDVRCTNKQGTSPTLQILIDRLASDNSSYMNIYDSTVKSVSGATSGTPVDIIGSIGQGCNINAEIGRSGRIRWAIGGSGGPGAFFNISLIAK